MTFQLAACAEMLWQDKPIHWRAVWRWALELARVGFGCLGKDGCKFHDHEWVSGWSIGG